MRRRGSYTPLVTAGLYESLWSNKTDKELFNVSLGTFKVPYVYLT